MYQRAIDMNALVADRDEKLKQRIGILIDMKRCSQVVGLEDIVKASDVYKDDNIKYAIAYCLYATDRLEKGRKLSKTNHTGQCIQKSSSATSNNR